MKNNKSIGRLSTEFPVDVYGLEEINELSNRLI